MAKHALISWPEEPVLGDENTMWGWKRVLDWRGYADRRAFHECATVSDAVAVRYDTRVWHRAFAGILLLVCLYSEAQAAAADANWNLVHQATNPKDVTLYTQDIEGSPLKAFRGITHSRADFKTILSVLLDMENMPAWFYRCTEAHLVSIDADANSGVGYIRLKGIWPVQDRDIATYGTLTQDADSLSVLLTATAAPTALPKMAGAVRIPELAAHWRVTPADDGWTEIELTGHAHPGGAIPVWIANMVVHMLPRLTLNNLHKRLAEPGSIRSLDEIQGGFILDGLRMPSG